MFVSESPHWYVWRVEMVYLGSETACESGSAAQARNQAMATPKCGGEFHRSMRCLPHMKFCAVLCLKVVEGFLDNS